MTEFATKDLSKPDWSLLDFNFLERGVKVLSHGAKKYGRMNWQKMNDPDDVYFSALMRHLVAYRNGELIDPETGEPHLAHAFCNIMFLNYFSEEHDG